MRTVLVRKQGSTRTGSILIYRTKRTKEARDACSLLYGLRSHTHAATHKKNTEAHSTAWCRQVRAYRHGVECFSLCAFMTPAAVTWLRRRSSCRGGCASTSPWSETPCGETWRCVRRAGARCGVLSPGLGIARCRVYGSPAHTRTLALGRCCCPCPRQAMERKYAAVSVKQAAAPGARVT